MGPRTNANAILLQVFRLQQPEEEEEGNHANKVLYWWSISIKVAWLLRALDGGVVLVVLRGYKRAGHRLAHSSVILIHAFHHGAIFRR